MANFCLNPLSAMGQCDTTKSAHEVIRELVECFEYISPAVKKGLHCLLIDSRLENGCLIYNENFRATISSLKSGGDLEKSLMRLWYIYTKNMGEQAEWEPFENISIGATGLSTSIKGDVAQRFAEENLEWFSIGGSDLNKSSSLNISKSSGAELKVRNFHNLDSLKKFLPQYEKSPKHGIKGYIDAAGDYVSPMTLPDWDAQKLLLISIQDTDDMIGYHELGGKYYRFKRTGSNIFHGFEVEEGSLSAHVIERLRNN